VATILVIDDDTDLEGFLRGKLESLGYTVEWLHDAHDGLEVLGQGGFDLVLLDNKIPKMSGLEFLGELRERGLDVPVILMTGYATIDTAVQAMKLGAFDYVVKPDRFQDFPGALQPLIQKALGISRSGKQRVWLPGETSPGDASGSLLLGNSPLMQQVCKQILKVAENDVPVLIQGATGTGKDLVAQAIHFHSHRMNKPFLAISCPGLNEELLEDELFGHVPGAFPGADKLRKGRFEEARDGTLFLDEVADMPPNLQGKLLDFLDHMVVRRIGSNEPIKVNVRLISATTCDLGEAARERRFRNDLFGRLRVVVIRLPTLHERGPEDLRQLAQHFLARAAEELGRPVPTLDEKTWQKMRDYSWPGNVRELRSCMLRAVLVYDGSPVLPADLDIETGNPAAMTPEETDEQEAVAALRQAIRRAWSSHQTNLYPLLHDMLRRELLIHAHTALQGDQDEAARRLGVPVEELRTWLQLPAPGGPDHYAREKADRRNLRRARAMTLIPQHPDWSVRDIARELGCSVATLWRDEVINRLLQSR
jgi:DNA-binding NtrC family response regulator